MPIVAGLFRDREQLPRVVDDLRAVGLDRDRVSLITSPTSAGDVAWQAARDAGRSEGGVVDLDLGLDGQAIGGAAGGERVAVEERVALGDVLLRVDAPDEDAAARAASILRQAGAARVIPGTSRS